MKKVFAKLSAIGICLGGLMTGSALGDSSQWGLEKGSPTIRSAQTIAFGPDGILLVGDAKSATVFALDTGDTQGDPNKATIELSGVENSVAELLKTDKAKVTILDLAVNPLSGNVYLSVSIAGEASADPTPAMVRVGTDGKLSQVSLSEVAFSKVTLPDAPEDKMSGEGRRRSNPRNESITDLAYLNGRVLVSGISNSAAPSSVREIAFPFTQATAGTSVEIYHAAHGKAEDYSAVRAFVPLMINGEPALLAGFTCTPLVRIELDSLEPGKKVKGTTVAELGNMNKPLDIVVYKKDGQEYLLMANSARGVMKVSTKGIERPEGLTEPVRGGGTAGQEFETISSLKGVVQLDLLGNSKALLLVKEENSSLSLKTIELP